MAENEEGDGNEMKYYYALKKKARHHRSPHTVAVGEVYINHLLNLCTKRLFSLFYYFREKKWLQINAKNDKVGSVFFVVLCVCV